MEDQLYTHCLYGKHGHIKESQQSNLRLIDTYKCNYLKRQCQCIEMCPAYKGLLRDGNKKMGEVSSNFFAVLKLDCSLDCREYSCWPECPLLFWLLESILL